MSEKSILKKITKGTVSQKEIDAAYLAIDLNKKTEWVDKRGNTVHHTRSWKSLLQFAEQILTEEIP